MKIQSRKSNPKAGITRITTIVIATDGVDGLVQVGEYALDTDFQCDDSLFCFNFHEIAADYHAHEVSPGVGDSCVRPIENGYVFEYE